MIDFITRNYQKELNKIHFEHHIFLHIKDNDTHVQVNFRIILGHDKCLTLEELVQYFETRKDIRFMATGYVYNSSKTIGIVYEITHLGKPHTEISYVLLEEADTGSTIIDLSDIINNVVEFTDDLVAIGDL